MGCVDRGAGDHGASGERVPPHSKLPRLDFFPLPCRRSESLQSGGQSKSIRGGGVSPMRGILSLIALSAVLPACCGCLAMPNLAHPGTEEHQQARAQVFEPYPENDPGPPVVGARPREYQDPRAEVTRASSQRPGDPILAPCPQSQAAAPIAQPPIVTAATGDLAVVPPDGLTASRRKGHSTLLMGGAMAFPGSRRHLRAMPRPVGTLASAGV